MLNITQIMRSQHISRWTIVATTRNQSLAEHTFNVTMLVRDFCRRVKMDDVLMMKAALEHDLDEVMTGDIPTPVKSRMREQGFDPKVLEGPAANVQTLSPFQRHVLKMIDVLESIHFIRNFGAGRRAEVVRDKLVDHFWDMHLDMINNGVCIWAHALQDMHMELISDDCEDA